MKRFLCIIVVITVFILVFSCGCEKNDAETESTATLTTTSSSETPAPETEDSATTVPESSESETEFTGMILPDDVLENALEFSKQQLLYTASIYPYDKFPHSTYTNGDWNPKTDVGLEFEQEWIEGFFPGCMWYMYELTGEEEWREKAEGWTANVEWHKNNTSTADIGFRLVCCFGIGYRLLQDEAYKDVLIKGASSLATRYNYYVHAVRNGDWYRWPEDRSLPAAFTLFNDDIMNVELMFMAGQFNHSVYTTMALNHCLTTYNDIVREDGGSYHLAEYNASSGEVLWLHTYQGQGDDTTWSRGQAWLIYGFTMAYRYTRDPRMLEYAKKVSEYWIENIPEDYVPYWDFQADGIPDAEKDSSAAAVTASAFLELSTYCTDQSEKDKYYEIAVRTLHSLSSPAYLAQGTDCKAILLHGVGYHPADIEIDVGLIFGDYYYLEALVRYVNMRDKGTIF